MSQTKKILVLEDEPSIRSFVVINLQRVGYEVVEAEAGEEALRLLREQPDIVQRVPLGHIASYLGITQQRLSVIRRQVKL